MIIIFCSSIMIRPHSRISGVKKLTWSSLKGWNRRWGGEPREMNITNHSCEALATSFEL